MEDDELLRIWPEGARARLLGESPYRYCTMVWRVDDSSFAARSVVVHVDSPDARDPHAQRPWAVFQATARHWQDAAQEAEGYALAWIGLWNEGGGRSRIQELRDHGERVTKRPWRHVVDQEAE